MNTDKEQAAAAFHLSSRGLATSSPRSSLNWNHAAHPSAERKSRMEQADRSEVVTKGALQRDG